MLLPGSLMALLRVFILSTFAQRNLLSEVWWHAGLDIPGHSQEHKVQTMAATSLTDTHHIPVVFTLHHCQVTDFHVAQSFVHVNQNSVQKGGVVNLLLYRAMVRIFTSETLTDLAVGNLFSLYFLPS